MRFLLELLFYFIALFLVSLDNKKKKALYHLAKGGGDEDRETVQESFQEGQS